MARFRTGAAPIASIKLTAARSSGRSEGSLNQIERLGEPGPQARDEDPAGGPVLADQVGLVATFNSADALAAAIRQRLRSGREWLARPRPPLGSQGLGDGVRCLLRDHDGGGMDIG
jgi:hypothetical protein